MTSMLVIGSVAFDTLHNATGKHERVLGGSATYASLSAAYFCNDVQLIGVVGTDFPDEAVNMLRKQGVDTQGLEVKEGKTFEWEGEYTADLTARTSLRTELNVFADFQPKVHAQAKNAEYVMLGNIHPALQLDVLGQLESRA